MDILFTGANILLVLLGFGLLILVHEAGHFIAAKWANIRTDAFAIGFGPVLCSWRKGIGFTLGSSGAEVVRRAGRPSRALTDSQLAQHGIGETEYSLRVLPLGGFVRMLGQDDLDPSAMSSDPRAYNRATIARRMVVISAGVIMNILLAALLFVIAFSMGVKFEAPVVGDVRPGSAAESAVLVSGDAGDASTLDSGMQPGDRVLSIDGRDMPTFADVQVAAAMAVPGETMLIDVQRAGQVVQLRATIAIDPATNMPSLGISPAASTTLWPNERVNKPLKRSLRSLGDSFRPAAGWTLIGLGTSREKMESVERWGQLEAAARRTQGETFTWWWRGVDGNEHQGAIRAKPQWQNLRYPDATSRTLVGMEQGIVGLVPMVEIGEVIPGSANEGILKPGDLVYAFDGVTAPRMRAFRDIVKQHGAGDVPMTVIRDGQRLDLTARIVDEGFFKSIAKLNVFLNYAWDAHRLAQPMDAIAMAGPAGTPATIATPVADLGIAPGSTFSVPGHDDLSPWRSLWIAIQYAIERGDDEVQITIDDGNGPREVAIPLDGVWTAKLAALQWQSPIPQSLFDAIQVVRSSGGDPIRAVSMGLHETWNFVVLTYVTIDRLFRGTVGVEQLHGPVGIVHLGTRIADRGVAYMLFFLALISVNLAVLNFLPLPIVDGGLMLYLIYEKFKGRPPSIGFQNSAALVGLLLIGSLFLITFYNDILRLVS